MENPDTIMSNSKKTNFSQKKLSKTHLIVFALIFALIGGYFVYQSFAAEAVTTVSHTTVGSGINQFNYTGLSSGNTSSVGSWGTAHSSATQNDMYQVRFWGTQIKVYGAKAADQGIAGISIDGLDPAKPTSGNDPNNNEIRADTYSSSPIGSSLLYTSPVLSEGYHLLHVRVTGLKNTSSSGTKIVADKVEITSNSSQPSASTTPNFEQLVYEDNFDTGTTENGKLIPDVSKWSYYGNDPADGSTTSGCWAGHANNGLRCKAALSVTGGNLVITAQNVDTNGDGIKDKVRSGGIASKTNIAYGKYVARIRTEADPTGTMSGLALTWPKCSEKIENGQTNCKETWPDDGELDWYETGTKLSRDPLYSFMHWPCNEGSCTDSYQSGFIFNGIDAASTNYHTVVMEWTPWSLQTSVDGVVINTWGEGREGYANSPKITNPKHIPDWPHHVTFQLDALKSTPFPDNTQTVHHYVDYVKVYKLNYPTTPAPADTTPPEVTWEAPVPNSANPPQVSGSFAEAANNCRVSAADTSGIDRVEFYLDNATTPLNTETTVPYNCFPVDTTQFANGSTHSIKAVAYDKAPVSNKKESVVTFTVQNETSGGGTNPSGEPMPIGDLPGWKQTFTDDFKTNVPLGSFPTAVSSKWNAYGPSTGPGNWTGTPTWAYYYPNKTTSFHNDMMDMWMHTETVNGISTPMITANQPKISGTSIYGDYQLYGRYAIRFKTDKFSHYHASYLLWPKADDLCDPDPTQPGCVKWPKSGEIDYPEGDFDGNISAYTHYQDGTSGADQQAFETSTPIYDAWHTAVIEWTPTSLKYILDGTTIGTTTQRIPNTPMRYVIQNGGSFSTGVAPSTVQGHVYVDWVSIYSYNSPSGGDTTPPALTWEAPTTNQVVSGSFTEAANNCRVGASDASGIDRVEFYFDNSTTPINTERFAPYNCFALDTTQYPDGPHSIKAVAYDVAVPQNKTEKVINFTIKNGVADTTPPVFPTGANLSATPISSTQINLSWPSASDNVAVTGYDILGSNGSVIAQLGASTTTYNHTGLSASTTYNYTVQARDGANNVTRLAATATTQAVSTDPSPPVSFTLSSGPAVSSQLNLSWTPSSDPESGIKEYRVFRDGSQIATVPTICSSACTWGTTVSVPVGPHNYYVQAVSGIDKTTQSNTISVTVDFDRPAFSTVTATPGNGQATLNWAATDDIGITRYEIWRNDVNTYVAGVPKEATSYTITGLTNDVTYSYRIVAYDSIGYTNSNIVSVKPSAGTTPNPTGWSLVWEDNFDGTAIDTSKWFLYGGTGGTDGHGGNGIRRADAWTVSNGKAIVTAENKVDTRDGITKVRSGGMSHNFDMTYGKYEARVRTDLDPKGVMSGVLLTWPNASCNDNNALCGENDYYETEHKVNSRSPFYSYIHWPDSPATNYQTQFVHNSDATQWHKVIMEWTAEYINVKVYSSPDGGPEVLVSDQTLLESQDPNRNNIPDVAHHATIQLDAFTKDLLQGPVKMEVDYIRAYKQSTSTSVDTTPPTTAITYPPNNAILGSTFTATATAQDNTGGSGVASVQFKVDGSVKMTDTDGSNGYNYTINTLDATAPLANGPHTIESVAYDVAGNPSTLAGSPNSKVSITVNNPDITKPNAPTNLRLNGTMTPTSVPLTWNAATDSGLNQTGVATYNVLRKGPADTAAVLIGSTTGLTYTDTTTNTPTPPGGPVAATSYSYSVQAVDTAGNVSLPSSPALPLTTPDVPDTVAPAVPTNLVATAASGYQVNLSWGASTDTGGSGLKGYNVYRNGATTPLNGNTPIQGTSYGDGTVQPTTTYSYTVEAVDGAGNMSGKTGGVEVVTPVAPVSLTILPSEDASISKKFPGRNYGANSQLKIDAAPNDQDGLLKFTVNGVGTKQVTSAKLRLYVAGSSNNGGTVHRLAGTNWNEASVTWDNAPAADTSSLASIGAVSGGSFIEINLASLITGDGTYGLRITSPSSDATGFNSKEASSNKPQLIVTAE